MKLSEYFVAIVIILLSLIYLDLAVIVGILLYQVGAIPQEASHAVLAVVAIFVVVIVGIPVCLIVFAGVWYCSYRRTQWQEIGRRKRRASDSDCVDSFRGPAGIMQYYRRNGWGHGWAG